MAELDDKYASVILRRYVEFKDGDPSDVFAERGRKKLTYASLVKVENMRTKLKSRESL